MIKFVAEIKLVSSKTLVSNDREIEIRLRTNDDSALALTQWQGEKLVEVNVNQYNHETGL